MPDEFHIAGVDQFKAYKGGNNSDHARYGVGTGNVQLCDECWNGGLCVNYKLVATKESPNGALVRCNQPWCTEEERVKYNNTVVSPLLANEMRMCATCIKMFVKTCACPGWKKNGKKCDCDREERDDVGAAAAAEEPLPSASNEC